MKKTVLASFVCLTAFSVSLSALAEESRGYVTEVKGYFTESLWYNGLTEDGKEVSFELDEDEKAVEMMKACTKKKATHAILFASGSAVCVKAPGFYEYWREEMAIRHSGT